MASNVNHPAASPASASGRSMLNRLERTASHVHNFVRRQRNEGTGLNEAEDDDDDFVRRLSSTFQTQRSCSPSSKKKKKASRGRPTDILSVKLTCLSSPETKITSNLDVNRLKRMGLGYHDSEIKLTGRVPTKLDLSMTSADFNQKLCNMFPILTNVAFELMTARKSKLESLPSSVNTPALIKELMSKEGRSGCLFIRPFTDITARCLQDFDMNAQPAVPLVDQAAGTSSRRSSAATSTSVVQKETLLEERALVATQNAEFQQSLITDQEKVRRLQNARKEIEEKEKKMLEFRNGKKRNLPEEPEEGIKLKFKTNTSWFDTTRKFLPEDNVQVLQDFICSLEDSSKKYVLTIPNRPPMKSSFCHGTLADLGISGNTLIQIQWLDDSKVVMEGESPENEELDDLLPPLVVQQRTRRRAAQHAEQIISRACVDIGVADTSSSDEEIVLDKEASGSNPAISSNLTLPLDQGNEEIGESGIPQVSNQEFQVEFENVHENAMNAEVPVLLPQPSTDKLQMALKSFAKEVLGNRVDGSMRMVIRRQTALDDALQNVARAQNRLLQPISVRFIGESAVDEGGPSRELSSEIVVQIKHSSCVEGI
ncbi:uncharacterized protein LOC134718196 [Mytilus trossulus]|uniref:uncharacterized protein LOC134718196 n=1 Tax=Mytilus trossulus TaxID=6551 RepID=UPI0030051419